MTALWAVRTALTEAAVEAARKSPVSSTNQKRSGKCRSVNLCKYMVRNRGGLFFDALFGLFHAALFVNETAAVEPCLNDFECGVDFVVCVAGAHKIHGLSCVRLVIGEVRAVKRFAARNIALGAK